MTPKQKAKDLFKRFHNIPSLALICVDEILNNVMEYWEITPDPYCVKTKLYWMEVKQEIEKL
jgi:hypothetical protein